MRWLGWLAVGMFAVLGLLIIASHDPKPSRPKGPEQAQSSASMIVPVSGVQRDRLTDNWHDPREGGARVHEALDIPAPGGTPVLAAIGGRVEKLFHSARGGITAYIRSADGKILTYYAHLSAYAAGLREGQPVAQGQQIGYVGDTGDSGPGNTHLHFAVHVMGPGEGWWQGTPVDPFPLLAARPLAREPAAR